MTVRAVALVALLLAAPVLAASSTDDDGECTFTGDWRSKATPVTTSGPPMHPYTSIGACVNAYAETRGSAVFFTLRADVFEPGPAPWIAKYKVGGSSGTFDCGRGFCSLGPFDANVSPGPACAHVELWKDGALARRAAACA